MPESLGGEIPRLLAEQFSDRTKNATLHEHPPVQVIVAMKPCHAFDGQSVQHNAVLCGDD